MQSLAQTTLRDPAHDLGVKDYGSILVSLTDSRESQTLLLIMVCVP